MAMKSEGIAVPMATTLIKAAVLLLAAACGRLEP